ncbi:HAD family hydrolase [Duganella dendranthematis]|jgi:FMN phosphatase YigB (HAD superfamily)|uniref:HAD family hydrolase n=1 Tax=Duganella dendranthematis TaxID=2728021 RepID=A0ABX6M7B9_9BURK|nr:HAD family hydrolase [Duganella dendranthematis]QJD90030.1 HAD family hydrolase [Duganella dendranthematis]
MADDIVFLIDCDNTLMDNDRVQSDLREHMEKEFGAEARDRYWSIYNELFAQLGYADYLGALQRYRIDAMNDPKLLLMAGWLMNYRFADRLYPGALDVIKHLRQWGKVVVLSDGDVVFQPRKVEYSGLWDAVDGNVLIYIHKETMLEQIEVAYPARHYVMIDDKVRILAAMKKGWGDRLTTVFPRQGHYAFADDVASFTTPDLTVDGIGDLLNYDLSAFAGIQKETVS